MYIALFIMYCNSAFYILTLSHASFIITVLFVKLHMRMLQRELPWGGFHLMGFCPRYGDRIIFFFIFVCTRSFLGPHITYVICGYDICSDINPYAHDNWSNKFLQFNFIHSYIWPIYLHSYILIFSSHTVWKMLLELSFPFLFQGIHFVVFINKTSFLWQFLLYYLSGAQGGD